MFYPSAACLLVLNDSSCLQVVDCVLFPFATLDASGGGIAEEGDQVDYQEEDQGQIADPGKPLHLLMSFVLLFYNMHVLPIYASACLSNVLSIQGLASPSWPLYIYSCMEKPSLIPTTHPCDV